LVLAKVSDVGVSTACGTSTTVPVRVAICGEPPALSATDTVAAKLAADAGVNVTEIVQLAAAASVPPQVVVSAKSLGLAPAIAMPAIVSAALPGLDSVIVCAAVVTPTVLEKVRAVGDRTACAAVPVPLSVAVCGEPLALSATETVAEKLAADAGVNVTEMVQFAAAASVVPQVLVWAKLLAPVPATEMPVIVNAALPGLDSVMVCAAAVTPTALVNVRAVGVRTACAAVPVPVSVTVCGEPVALSATDIAAVRPLPALVGVNVTEIVQLPPAASDAPQLLVSA